MCINLYLTCPADITTVDVGVTSVIELECMKLAGVVDGQPNVRNLLELLIKTLCQKLPGACPLMGHFGL